MIQSDTDKEVLSIREVSRLLGRGINQCYEDARQGRFPVRKLGGRLLVPKRAFMAWLNGTDEVQAEASDGD